MALITLFILLVKICIF